MKKSLLITLEYPPMKGGVASHYSNIVENLEHDKIKVFVPKFTPFPIWPKWIFWFLDVFKIIKKEKIELLMVGQALPVGYIALVFYLFFRLPYIVFTHGMDVTIPWQSSWKRFWVKTILRRAHKIISNSNFTKSKVMLYGVKEGNIVIFYPCPRIKDTTEIQIPEELKDKKVLLTVGRLVERKGHDVVISALPQVLHQIPNLIYVIVGEGPYCDVLEKLVHNLGLEENVVFRNKVSNEELKKWYNACDVFIMVSRELPNGDCEGFGLVYLEANLFSKPVIAGRSGGVEDAIEDGVNGLLVNPKDKNEIVQAIIKLMEDEELRRKLGEQGRQRVLENFRMDKQIYEHTNVFDVNL